MRKDEAKKRASKLLAKLQDLQAEFEELKYDLEGAAEEVEPYEGRDELTQAQEERVEWFEDVASALDDIVDLDLAGNLADYDIEAEN